MKRIKDFLYNKNDIIIVLIILAVAALIIYSRIDSIMDYPEKLAKKAAATQTEQTTETASEPTVVSVTISEEDTVASVSQFLYEEELSASASEFEDYFNEQDETNDDDLTLKVGTFQIPIDSSQEEIFDIITE